MLLHINFLGDHVYMLYKRSSGLSLREMLEPIKLLKHAIN